MFDKLFEFEAKLAEYTGAPYVVLTDGCTHALELAFRYYKITYCRFPAHTYLSIPQMLNSIDVVYDMVDERWDQEGEYQFGATNIWDSARLLKKGMYRPGQVQCLSFGHSKPLEIGKCGAILLDDKAAYTELSKMRSDGRDLHISPWQDQPEFKQGYHYCPTIEACLVGLCKLPLVTIPITKQRYPDLRKIAFNNHP